MHVEQAMSTEAGHDLSFNPVASYLISDVLKFCVVWIIKAFL